MEKLIRIESGRVSLEGILKIPKKAQVVILFAHGSGSSKLSPRNTFVANVLQKEGLGTLLIDLLTEKEDAVYETRFNIRLLTNRLIDIVHWLKKQIETQKLAIGLFGASTGAAAALETAAIMRDEIYAVVSRGGRPDLALESLPRVSSPTLLIVGERDDDVLAMNQEAYQKLNCVKKLEIVPRATHLFEEPGCLEEVARLAKEWFIRK